MNHLIFLGQVVGIDTLTLDDKRMLQRFGVDIEVIRTDWTNLEQSFYWGRLSQALQQQSYKVKYNDFLEYLRRGQYIPLNTTEQYALSYVKQNTYGHIKGLGDRIKQTVNGIITENDPLLRSSYEEVIRSSAERTLIERDSLQNMVLEIGHRTGDWQRDLGRIAATEMQNAVQYGRAEQIKREGGSDQLVYKDVYPQACRHCIRLFLTDGIGSQPILFKLKDLQSNGTNIGLKTKDWVATLGAVHPFSITDGRTPILTSTGWESIENIEIGDLVLTHKGRFKKVLSTIKNYPCPYKEESHKYSYTIYYKHRNKKEPEPVCNLTFTEEHKVLTQRGWVMVKDLTKADSLVKLLKKCVICDNYMESFANDSRCCCSDECSGKFRAKSAHKIWDKSKEEVDEIKRKISKKVIKNWEDGIYINTLNHLKSKERTDNTRERMLNGGAIHAIRSASGGKISKPQMKLYETILSLYPDAQLEYPIFNRSLDIALVNYKIDIEFDGNFWHKNRKDEDKKRDDLLKRKGWKVLRYSNIPKIGILRVDIENITQNDNHLYKFDKSEILFIKKNFTGSFTKLYDIEVEEDESFIARGVVVHNCRCQLHSLPNGYVWDEESEMFSPPKVDKEKRKPLGIVVHVGDKTFNV